MGLIKRLLISSLFLIYLSGFSYPDNPTKTLWSVSSFGDDDFFYRPSDICLDYDRSRIYVADSGNDRVIVFDFQGKFITVIGRRGQGPAEFINPSGLFVFEDGRLAVADFDNHRIQIFDRDGEFFESIGTKSVSVADMIFKNDKIYTISTFGSSGYVLDRSSEKDVQPLVNVLNNQGDLIQSYSIDSFPESHPFLRAIKHRVSMAMSDNGRLYLPHFAMNVIHVFDLRDRKILEFDRDLPFKPAAPKLVKQVSGEDGIIRMQALFDFVTQDARIGPDGHLYLLTFTESYVDRAEKINRGMDLPPHPMRIEKIDAGTHEIIRRIECDGGIKTFALLDENRIVYIFTDREDEVFLKCIQH